MPLKPITAHPSNDASARGVERSLGARLAIAAIRGYKVFISPYFRGSCRFLPSCADYAADAYARHGVAYGTWLSLNRLARCHPLCAAGHDPVPTELQRRKSSESLRDRTHG